MKMCWKSNAFNSILAFVLSCLTLIVVIRKFSSNIYQIKLLEVKSSPKGLLDITPVHDKSLPVSANWRVWVPEDSVFDLNVLYAKVTRLLFLHQNSTPDPLIEHSRGVEVLSDGIKILHPGLYYIYSNLHFKTSNITPCTDLIHMMTTNSIQKTMEGDPQHTTILAMARHVCPDTCVLDEETSYTAKTTILQAGDVIRVVVSGYGLNHLQRESSFVGLFMLAAV